MSGGGAIGKARAASLPAASALGGRQKGAIALYSLWNWRCGRLNRAASDAAHMMAFVSRSTWMTSSGIIRWLSARSRISLSMPTRKGTGACRMSISRIGRMGMYTCCQLNGNSNAESVSAAIVRTCGCVHCSTTFCSASRRAHNMITLLASSAWKSCRKSRPALVCGS